MERAWMERERAASQGASLLGRWTSPMTSLLQICAGLSSVNARRSRSHMMLGAAAASRHVRHTRGTVLILQQWMSLLARRCGCPVSRQVAILPLNAGRSSSAKTPQELHNLMSDGVLTLHADCLLLSLSGRLKQPRDCVESYRQLICTVGA